MKSGVSLLLKSIAPVRLCPMAELARMYRCAQVCKRHGINHTTIQIERAGTNDLDNCNAINVVCDSS